MKRALIATTAVALLALAGCAGGDEAVTTGSAPATSQSTTTEAAPAAGGSVNDQVREACRAAVTEKLAGAEFPTRGTLRAASSEGGRLFTLTGVAQADGSGHPYTCSLTEAGGEVSVDEVLVDGQ